MAEHIRDHENGGSSIANATATNSLRNKLNHIWQNLKSKANDLAFWHKSKSIPTEAELFLLLCTLFPDDFGIPMNDLILYGMGLELFQHVHLLSGARGRVSDIVSTINGMKDCRKASGGKIRLAREIDGPVDQFVEMLEGARELAKSIASSYPLVFRRETVIKDWPEPSSYKNCYGISLVLKKVNEHPVNLECPRLALLQLQYREDSQSIPFGFFEGMQELLVLSLDLPSLPQSLNVLRNLKTLRLKLCKCEDMSLIGGLINLEFLSVSILSSTEIPREMGQLVKLRLLDLQNMNIAYVPPGVFSRLLKLEELYLPLSFKRWGRKAKDRSYNDYDEWGSEEQDNYDVEGRICANLGEADDGERINTSIIDITSDSLKALQICVQKVSVLPNNLLFINIQDFKILMPINGLYHYQPYGTYSTNVLQLTGEASDIKKSGIRYLLSRAGYLSLNKVQNLKNVICELDDYVFPQLKKMIISECDQLECVASMKKMPVPATIRPRPYLFQQLECLHLSMLRNLEEIFCYGLIGLIRFTNLSQISIRFCPKLKYVFPLKILRGLRLKSLEILDCVEMEGIFYSYKGIFYYDEKDEIPLGSIERLDLHSLPRFISLLQHKDAKIDEVHNDINKSLTINKVKAQIFFLAEPIALVVIKLVLLVR